MKNVAYVFPGQASQYSGMGKELYDNFPEARQVFWEADEAIGFPISKYCFEGKNEDLKRTEITQPAILTASVAAYAVLSEHAGYPLVAAGHSLGEYSALVASGVMKFSEAVVIVHHRGKYMQEAVPVGEGAMAAIIGLDHELVKKLCKETAGNQVVTPANYNTPSQVVVSGHKPAVERVMDLCKQNSAKKVVMLPVSAPFHCSLMEPAAEKLEPELVGLHLGTFSFKVLKNVDTEPYSSPSEIAGTLKSQITQPVMWQGCVEKLVDLGVKNVVEVGPGRILSGLIKRIDRSLNLLSFENVDSSRKTLGALSPFS